MPVNHGEFAKRVTLSTSEAGLGVWYNVSADLHRKCIVHASIALPFGRKDLVFNSSTGTGYSPAALEHCVSWDVPDPRW